MHLLILIFSCHCPALRLNVFCILVGLPVISGQLTMDEDGMPLVDVNIDPGQQKVLLFKKL
jgi:hypothetical protein